MPTASPSRLRAIPGGVWALGLVSLCMDVSSEMIHALLPLYLVTVLGASMVTVGLIEGIAEATAVLVKLFSGALSDWLGRRKLLTVIGYGLAAVTKPVFPLAGGIGWLVGARFVDRIGKGIRGAPRDALIADLSPPELRGASFGLRQSLDTVGGFLGPLLAMALMLLTAGNYTQVFWFAVLPAFVSVALLVLLVKEPPRRADAPRMRPSLAHAGRLPATFWAVVAVGSLLTLARFSEAFLILRAQDLGLAASYAPLVLVLMSLAYALSAYPAGALSDTAGRRGLFAIGIAFLLAADLVLAFAASLPMLGLGVLLWGLHMGFTQGLLATLVADTAPADLRGTAFGVFSLGTGVALFAASVLAGLLWDAHGPEATFLTGAALTAVALAGLLVLLRSPAGPCPG